MMVANGIATAQYQRPRKKLIQYGWGVPYTDFVRQNIAEMEKREFFDGIVVRLRGGWKSYPAHIFRKTPTDPKEYDDDITDLRATGFKKFTENFILIWGTAEKGWDWFSESDWQAAEYNSLLIAYVAKVGGCIGICFDPEPYDGNLWHYPSQPQAPAKTFDDYWRRVRECGAKFIQALQRQMPNLRLLTFFQCSLFGDIVDIPDPKERMERLSKHPYGLLPAFLNGMLDAAQPTVTIVDGNEPAYYYTNPEQYFHAYHLMRQRALSLIAPENRNKYALQVQAGFALYMDWCFGLWPPERRILGHFLSPDERARWFEHNVYYALQATDEYVWCYSEKLDWWGTQARAPWHKFVPQGAEEAVRSARHKLEQGQPLGFSVGEMLDEAQKRKRAETEKRLIRRTATLRKLRPDEKPPVIDGKLDDAVWKATEPLDGFVPNLGSGRTKPSVATHAWVVYDDRHLYVAFLCEEPTPQQMRVIGEKRDDEIWRGDCVEVFVSRGEVPQPYWHFIVNPKGVQWDSTSADGGDDPRFDAGWQSAVVIGEKAWTVEIAIPWDAVGGAPKGGEKRQANLCRHRRAGDTDLSTWSQVVSGFQEAENFGIWVFGQ